MHSRHRGPGNGYNRSIPRGMGGPPSRIPPENSFRGGHMMYNDYNPEYRNYNHGYGRGVPMPPGPPPPHVGPPTPQRRVDVFSEAGRLATEYLISRGVLPPNVLSGNWQNGSLKKLIGDFRGFRNQEKESLPHHRLKNGSESGLKSHSRDKRGLENNESDYGREIVRSSSLLEKNKSKLDSEEKGVESEGGKAGQMSSQSGELNSKKDVTVEPRPLVDNLIFDKNDKKADYGKDLGALTDKELLPKTNDDVKLLDKETVDLKDKSNSCLVEISKTEDDNLLSLGTFSQLGDLVPIIEEKKDSNVSKEKDSEDGALAESEVVFKDVSVDNSSVIETPNLIEGSKCADHDSKRQIPDEKDFKNNDLGKYSRSQSLPLSSFIFEHESNEGFLEIGRCSSMVIERGEKRAAEYIDDNVAIKKSREWDENSHSNLIQDQQAVEKVGGVTSGKSLLNNNSVEVMDYTEEMQLFPASFKICDLNTVEARNEISVPDSSLLLQSGLASEKEIDVLTSNNRDILGKYSTRGVDGKEIEVIDLDDDCLQEDIVFGSSERKEDAVFMGTESFPDHAQIVDEISGDQDGYGLMISDFLGNDIAGSGNVNSLQNDMALDNGEGILGDDESIYMSLGEIPISFLGVWERSTQDFDNKPF